MNNDGLIVKKRYISFTFEEDGFSRKVFDDKSGQIIVYNKNKKIHILNHPYYVDYNLLINEI